MRFEQNFMKHSHLSMTCNNVISLLKNNTPIAVARIHGNTGMPNLFGQVCFYNVASGGILVVAEVIGLPDTDSATSTSQTNATTAPSSPTTNQMEHTTSNHSNFYGMHIHEFGNCTIPFDQTGNHYNPSNTDHPFHAGDLPPLLSNQGYAWTAFFDNRFTTKEIIGKSIVIHHMRDDFSSQPSGDSGMKIGCGVIYEYVG